MADEDEKKLNLPIEWHGVVSYPHFERYVETKNICILLYTQEGELYAKATTNHPAFKMPDDRVLIKDWTENVGLPAVLIKAGLIGERIPNDACPYPIYQLLKKPDNF